MDQQIGIGLFGGFIRSPVTNQESRQLPMAHLSRIKEDDDNVLGFQKAAVKRGPQDGHAMEKQGYILVKSYANQLKDAIRLYMVN